jgi:hypothetical protein
MKKVLLLIFKSFLLPIVVALATFLITTWQNEAKENNRVMKYADFLEEKFNIQIERKWQEFTDDSLWLEKERADSLEKIKGDMVDRDIYESGVTEKYKGRLNEKYDRLLRKKNLECQIFEEDRNLHLGGVRETGILLIAK